MPIHGTVTSAREPVIVLETLPTRRKISLIIDTGFSGELCLPLRMIKSLGFQHTGGNHLCWQMAELCEQMSTRDKFVGLIRDSLLR
ncbi:MAG: hypothetical protein A3H45_06040 [Ignavibacteria bacterium RIFCSPLOWO2_02_FULL_55_14]|nr:MAG: hypothetical protein A3H45_06040 [Ignavibacteria bacterium RIFCSPLOWO2_02_FULL_55_14]